MQILELFIQFFEFIRMGEELKAKRLIEHFEHFHVELEQTGTMGTVVVEIILNLTLVGAEFAERALKNLRILKRDHIIALGVEDIHRCDGAESGRCVLFEFGEEDSVLRRWSV